MMLRERINNLKENGFIEFRHDEMFSDGSGYIYDQSFTYMKKNNLEAALDPDYGTTVFTKRDGTFNLYFPKEVEWLIIDSDENSVELLLGGLTDLSIRTF